MFVVMTPIGEKDGMSRLSDGWRRLQDQVRVDWNGAAIPLQKEAIHCRSCGCILSVADWSTCLFQNCFQVSTRSIPDSTMNGGKSLRTTLHASLRWSLLPNYSLPTLFSLSPIHILSRRSGYSAQFTSSHTKQVCEYWTTRLAKSLHLW